MKKSPAQHVLALLLALLLLPAALPPVRAAAEPPAKLRIALFSDNHYFPEEYSGGYGEAYKENNIVGQPVEQGPGILRSALAALKARAARGELDYLIVTGDLTSTGEYLGHSQVAQMLEDFERETGVSAAVIPGNHDIDYGPRDYSSGVREDARGTTHQDFLEIYANLGYDLPGLARFTPAGEDDTGMLSYAADLGENYRLIALDTHKRRIEPDLRAWAVEQCRAARAAGKTIVGIGHHSLNEAFDGQLVVMQNEDIENMREISEEFADAGMHFYFSGHIHMDEISPWYSDKGEVLYDIIVPGLYNFPGGFRVVDFSAQGGRVEADVRTYSPDEVLPVNANGITYPQPYYASNLGFSFGYNGEGLSGFVKESARRMLTGQLKDLEASGGLAAKVKETVDLAPINALMGYLDQRLLSQPEKIVELVNGLVEDIFALRVSKLPCARFLDLLKFGDPAKPGTLEDAGNSILTYMFWKKFDPKEDAFLQDVLRRMKNGELVDQLLTFAVPKVLSVLGEEILPLLANVDIQAANLALQAALGSLNVPLFLVLALIPGTRDTISNTLYTFASGAVTSQSPTGSGDGKLVYDGPVAAPTGPKTFRLPYDLSVKAGSLGGSAEITWYTKESLRSPGLQLTGAGGETVEGLSVTCTSEPVELTVNELDLGVAQILGTRMNAMKHTAKVEGLEPFKTYQFTAGDSEAGWWSAPQTLEPTDKPVLTFFRQVWAWVLGVLRLPGIVWDNLWFYGL